MQNFFLSYSLLKAFNISLIIIGFLSFSVGCKNNKSSSLNQVFLSVDSHTFTVQDFLNRLKEDVSYENEDLFKNKEWWDLTKKRMILSLIEEALYSLWAKKQDLIVTKDLLNVRINEIRKHYPNDFFFKQNLAQRELSFIQWKKKVERDLLRSLVLDKMTGSITVTEKEIADFYGKNKNLFTHKKSIFVDLMLFDDQLSASKIYEQTQKNSSLFKELKAFSSEPQRTAQWVDIEDQSPLSILFDWPLNKLSPLIETPFGYTFGFVKQKRSDGLLSLKEVENKVKDDLKESKKKDLLAQWIKTELELHKIKLDDSLINSIEIFKKASR